MLEFDACYRAVEARDARFDGRFFTAVTSTGIYCRPICPARTPARRNVRFYPDAAGAEAAGFRPCKRCRPETSPGSRDWDVRGDLVGRALRLIEEGVVDELGVPGLARRLAVTDRHLHRLFLAELGVAPLAVARTRRLRLARRLLHETDLPITEIAFASGFGSVRQFNASLREAYRLSPSELRAARPRGTAAAGPPALRLKLALRPPFDGAALLGWLRARAIPGVEEVTETTYRRTVPGGTVELTPAERHVTLLASCEAGTAVARIVARSRRLFDLDADPAAVAEVLSADPLLAPLVAARPGLRVPGAYDGFELAVRAVLGQQVSVAGARTLAARLVARCGTPAPTTTGDPAGTPVPPSTVATRGGGAPTMAEPAATPVPRPTAEARGGGAPTTAEPAGTPVPRPTAEARSGGAPTTAEPAGTPVPPSTAGARGGSGGVPVPLGFVFPAAEVVAGADLSGLGLTGARERTLHALAAAVAEGELDLDGGDPVDTEKALLALPGIGPWTASYIAMRALRDPDAFPSGDLVLRRLLDSHGLDEARTESWRPWRAYAAMHLWASNPVPSSSGK